MSLLRRDIKFMVQDVLPPPGTNVLWMDTSVPDKPVLKYFNNGNWVPCHTDESKEISLLVNSVKELSTVTTKQQQTINELSTYTAKEATNQEILEKVNTLDIETIAKESSVQSAISEAIAAKQVASTITGYALQGSDPTATNTAILQAIPDISGLATETNATANKNAILAEIGPLSQAAEAYNTGKTELAANITAKGVEASASESLPALAEKVSLIHQDTYEIDGGEIFEKQLYGGATSVANENGVYVQTGGSLWNLYEVMTQLKSDARFIGYGGILLAEYFKGYDTIELMNAGAGGAYFTCDGDFYTIDKAGENAHVWHDYENGMINRWVAYLFAAEGTNYTIPSTNLCPRSIHIGRKVGTIYCASAGRIREIVVTDGNELYGTNFSDTQVWQQEVVLRNIKQISGGSVINGNSNIISLQIDCETTAEGTIARGYCPNLVYIYAPNMTSMQSGDRLGMSLLSASVDTIHFPKLTRLALSGLFYGGRLSCKHFIAEDLTSFGRWIWWGQTSQETIVTPSLLNASWQLFYQTTMPNLIDFWVGEMTGNCDVRAWNPTNVLADIDKKTQLIENIKNHILARVSDATGGTQLVFTISTNMYNAVANENIEWQGQTMTLADAFLTKNWLLAGA